MSVGSAEEQDAADKAADHAGTPTTIHLDTLAQAFYTLQLSEIAGTPLESYVDLDIQGNRIAVHDARGLTPLTYAYNLLKAIVTQTSIDSGRQYMMTDAAGQPLYAWDAEDRQFHFSYDELRRPLTKEVTEGITTYVLEETIYGEGEPTPHLNNLRGQVYQQYDNAGMSQVDAYDFKGVPLSPKQQLLDDHTIVNVDWAGSPTLDAEVFTTTVTIDALGRPVTQTDAGGNVTEYTYDKAGALKAVELNTDSYVNDIHYNARGQREAIWYGNGTKTAYTYDDKTYRLIRLLTTKSSDIYQDLQYWYDPVGNITQIQDDAQQTLYYSGSVVAPDQDFTYDALYRLITAEGRELIGTATFGAGDNIDDAAWKTSHIGNGAAVQNYTQTYEYDAVGNILELQHAATAGSYTRTYDYDAASNRLDSTEVGVTTYSYTYDDRGNILTMPHLPTMVWNAQNELHKTGNGSVNTYFNYNGGQRIRKVCEKPGAIREERIYMGSFELYRKYVSGTKTLERTTVHVSDDTGRIAMLEERTVGSDSAPANLQRYIYSNHLSTASLELDENAAIISYEEYHPYGTTSYQAMNASINAVAKRYRYTGKERDEETGLYYHGARYYIPWLCRWSAVDPMENKYAGQSPYNYGFNNPISFNDPDGMDPGSGSVSNASTGSATVVTSGNGTNHATLGEVTVTAKKKEGPPEEKKEMYGPGGGGGGGGGSASGKPNRYGSAADNTRLKPMIIGDNTFVEKPQVDYFAPTAGMLTHTLEKVSDDFIFAQKKTNRRTVSYGEAQLMDKATVPKNYKTNNTLQNANKYVNAGGKVADAVGALNDISKTGELYSLAKQDSAKYHAKFQETRNETIINAIKTYGPYIVKRAAPVVIVYDVANMVSDHYESDPQWRRQTANMAYKEMQKATNNRVYNRWATLYEEYREKKPYVQPVFRQGRR